MNTKEGPGKAHSNPTVLVASVAANPQFLRFRGLPAGRDLPVDDAMALFSCFEEDRFHKGEEIYAAGSISRRTVYMVLQGCVSLRDDSGNFYSTLRAGDMFGLFSFLDDRPHSVTVMASEEVAVLSLNRSYFDLITLQDPLLGNRLLMFMFRLLSHMSLDLGTEYAALRDYERSRSKLMEHL